MEAPSGGFFSPGNQTLTLAFLLGLIFQAGLASFLLLIKGHAKTIFREGPRLALVCFLLFGGLLWSQLSFGALLLPKIPSVCQGVLILQVVFDQLARCLIEQFLLWKVTEGVKVSLIAFIMQGILLIRLVAGGVVVGFSRPSFAPSCVVETSLLPASIVVVTLDSIIITFLLVRTGTLGMFGNLRRKDAPTQKLQSKAFILTVGSFTLWTASSVIMVLGLPGTQLIIKMGAPANGILVLITVLTLFGETLLSLREDVKTTPEAQSPYTAQNTAPRALVSGGPGAGNGTPVNTNRFGQKHGSLVVVNESPRGSSSPFNSLRASSRGFSRIAEGSKQKSLSMSQERSTNTQQGVTNRGSSGVFGTIINQAILKSPGRIPFEERQSSPPTKQSFFNWPRPAAKLPIRELGISRPIMVSEDDTEERPFARVPTIDLATAQRNENERRQMARAKASPLTFNPIIQPPMLAVREEPNEENSAAVQAPQFPIPQGRYNLVPRLGPVSSRRSDAQIGATTSTSLSPLPQDVRRRSPRGMSGFDFDLKEKTIPASVPPAHRLTVTGLPSNPRSRGLPLKKPAPSTGPTVMLMSDIVYDSPMIVNNIIQGASTVSLAAQRPKTADPLSIVAFSESGSVPELSILHRPRPFKRDFEKDRAIFPAEPYTRHKRSRSTGSLLTLQQSATDTLLDITKTLPLSHIPKSAAELKKILPNEQRTLTIDEKVELLFPAPPASNLPSRRSSVPSIPRIPSMFLPSIPEVASPSLKLSSRASRRTTIASLAQISNSGFSPVVNTENGVKHPRINSRQDIKVQDVPFEYSRVSDNWRGKETMADKILPSTLVDHKSPSTETVSTDQLEIDNVSTYWGSIHSGVPQVDLEQARQRARSTYIKGVDQSEAEEFPMPSPYIENDANDVIPVMLDDGTASYCSYIKSTRSSRNLSRDDTLYLVSSFHHRIGGEKPPTFSQRALPHRIRKVRVPPALNLYNNGAGRATNIVIQATEPSPISSPELIIAEINAQLDRMEAENNRLSYVSSQPTGDSQMRSKERMQLLENLEREMQDIEKLQIELNRNSMSTTTSSASLSPHPPPKVNLMSQMISNRRSNRISGASTHADRLRNDLDSSNIRNAISNVSSQYSKNSRTSLWQQRLSEAQLAYAESAPSTLRNSLNFLPMPNLQIASPTPPDSLKSETDSEYEADGILNEQLDLDMDDRSPVRLWQPSPPSPGGAYGRLWTHPYEKRSVSNSPEPPARSTRPRQRYVETATQISSSALWTKNPLSTVTRTQPGLWQSATYCAVNITARSRPRLSVKPKRKSRPLTLLPDIVESPVPIPYKKETLGIYQFPWGETSDQAIYQPAFISGVHLPSIVTSTRLNERSLQLEAEEYSSSFFDDYEDDESGDEEASAEESDDEFDDNTLFEIADLLRSNDVPSRNSLLSPGMVVRDYIDDMEYQSGSDVDEPQPKTSLPPMRLPIPPLDFPLRSPAGLNAGTKGSFDEYNAKSISDAESSYDSNSEKEDIINIASNVESPILHKRFHHVSSETNKSDFASSLPLQSCQVENQLPIVANSSQHISISPISPVNLLWTAPRVVTNRPHHMGLFVPSELVTNVVISSPLPAYVDSSRKSRLLSSNTLPKLESSKMWSTKQTLPMEHDWISESSIRAISPSAYSPSPFSAITSTTSELSDDMFDNASVRTASTKASTLWNAVTTLTPTWLQARSDFLSPKRNPSISSTDARKPVSDLLSPMSNVSDREAELNSRIPKMRRQKSLEKCQKIKETNDAIRRNALPEVPEFDTTHLSESMPSKIPTQFSSSAIQGINQRQTSPKRQLPTKIEADEKNALTEVAVAGIVKPQRIIRPTISKDAWIAELNSKAVIIGPAFVRKVKPIATEAEWVAALNEAISAGKVNKLAKPMVSKEEWVHHLEQAVHKSKVIGSIQVEKVSLWTQPTVQDRSIPSSLWELPSSSEKVPPNRFANAITFAPILKSRRSDDIDLAVLKSSNLWSSSSFSKRVEVNWLEEQQPSLSRAITWSPRKSVETNDDTTSTQLWKSSLQSNSPASPRSLFANVVASPLRRSPRTSLNTKLPALKSDTLFRTTEVQLSPVSWLNTHTSLSDSTAEVPRSIMTTASVETAFGQSTKHALTWSKPIKTSNVPNANASLWQGTPTKIERSRATIEFEHMIVPRTHRWRVTSPETTVTALDDVSGSLWKPKDLADEVIERNWLLYRAWWVRN